MYPIYLPRDLMRRNRRHRQEKSERSLSGLAVLVLILVCVSLSSAVRLVRRLVARTAHSRKSSSNSERMLHPLRLEPTPLFRTHVHLRAGPCDNQPALREAIPRQNLMEQCVGLTRDPRFATQWTTCSKINKQSADEVESVECDRAPVLYWT